MSKPIPVTIRLVSKFDEIINLWGQGKTQQEIGEQIGESRRTIMKVCKHLELSRTVTEAASLKNKSELDDPEIIEKIRSIRNTKSLQEIAKEVGGSSTTVSRICNKYGIGLDQNKFRSLQSQKMKNAWTPEKREKISGSKYERLNDTKWLHERYIIEGKSIGEIAELVGSNIGMVAYHLSRHNIKKRDKQQYLSRLRRKSAKITRMETYWGEFRFQSKQEVAFISNLSKNDEVEYEPITLEHNGCQYVPDFKVNGEYVEIKPPEYAKYSGADRQKFVKQFRIAEANNIKLKCWYKGRYFSCEPLGDLDRYFASDWRIFFKSSQECFEFLLSFGFRPLQWDKDHLLGGLSKLFRAEGEQRLDANLRNESALNLIKHFSSHYWSSTHKNYNTISDAFSPGNRMVLFKAVEKLWGRKNNINIYNLVKVIARHYKDFATVSIFKPWVAAYIYDRYLLNGGTVVDPCMGWGGRLLGIVDRDIHYRGFDLNPNVIESHQAMCKFLGSRLVNEPEFLCEDSSKCDFGEADLLFTSPPYDDTEYYDGLGEQCSDSFGIYENIFGSSCKLVVLNVPRRHRSLCVGIAEDNQFLLEDCLDMKTASFMGRERTSEPILVFRRQ